MTPECQDFIKSLLMVDPKQRLGFDGADSVKKHPFFNGIDWGRLKTDIAPIIPEKIETHREGVGNVTNIFEDEINKENANLEPAKGTGAQLDTDLFDFINVKEIHNTHVHEFKKYK
jgi:hypothetical protein